ncbi:MAG: toprim domain-containing protein [Candidatus Paceibacterota bacterium]
MTDNLIEKLTAMFIRFPGIGPRQARRFVYHLLRDNPENVRRLAETISQLRVHTGQCRQCYRYFTGNNQTICNLCSDQSRDKHSLMIVEKDADLETIRKTDVYAGLFFVLGGLIPVLEKKPGQRIRLTELKAGLKKLKPQEVIIALAVSDSGDATAEYLRSELAELARDLNFKISLLGRGLSTGTELEYSDYRTLDDALKNRH